MNDTVPPSMRINLRPATLAAKNLLQHWDEQPYVVDSHPNDDWGWEVELDRAPECRKQLIAEIDGRPNQPIPDSIYILLNLKFPSFHAVPSSLLTKKVNYRRKQ